MNELNNILSDSGAHNGLPEEKLMAYLEGRLSPAEQHEVELWLSAEGMESDAVEGLRTLHPGEARFSVKKLNHRLRKAAGRKRKRRQPAFNQFSWMAILIILLLVIVAYIVMRKAM